MATQPEVLDDEFDDTQEVEEQLEPEVEGVDGELSEEDEPEGEEEDQVTFGGAAIEGGDEPEGVRNLREALKREKEARKAAEAKLAPVVEDIGPEPSIDDYWEAENQQAAWRKDWDAWRAKADTLDQRRKTAEQEAEAAKREYDEVERKFEEGGVALRVKDYAPARDAVLDRLTPDQKAMMLMAAEKPAALVYALGKHPERLEALLKEGNPIRFTAAVARLDREVGVTAKRKPQGVVEEVHRGAGGAGRTDTRLAALEAEAAKTGDRTKVVAYKRMQKEKAK